MAWKILNIFGIIVGIAFLVEASVSATTNFQFLTRAQKTDGIVINVVQQYEWSRSFINLHYYPQIEFTTQAGQSITFISNVGEENTNPSAFQVGDHVSVEYDPKNPNNAEVASSFAGSVVWLNTFAFLLFALCAFIVPVALKNKFDVWESSKAV